MISTPLTPLTPPIPLTTRRGAMTCIVWSLAWPAWGATASAAQGLKIDTAQSQLVRAVQRFTGGAAVAAGDVRFDVAALVENGNTVPIEIDVASAMTPQDHVRRIAVFSERNPLPDVLIATLTPACGRARVVARIRLSTTQRLVAVAERSDGTYLGATVDVIVTLAACVEEAPVR